MASRDLATVTSDRFEAWLGGTFRLEAGGGLDLRLTEVRRQGGDGRSGGAFALTFLAPPGPFLPQAIYLLEHPELGRQEIFLVPLGPQDGGNAYEAVFG